jgi:hypothetical protein
MEHTTWKCEPRKSLAKARGLMIRLLPLVLVILVLAMFGGCQQTRSTGGATRSSAVPDFVQVGKRYEFHTESTDRRVRVLEIRPDEWVRVEESSGEVEWFNVNHVFIIKEVGQ